MCIHAYIYKHTQVDLPLTFLCDETVRIFVSLNILTYTHTCTHTHANTYKHRSTCCRPSHATKLRGYTNVFTYTHTCVCKHTYTYTHRWICCRPSHAMKLRATPQSPANACAYSQGLWKRQRQQSGSLFELNYRIHMGWLRSVGS